MSPAPAEIVTRTCKAAGCTRKFSAPATDPFETCPNCRRALVLDFPVLASPLRLIGARARRLRAPKGE